MFLKFYMAQICFSKGFYICIETTSWLIINKSKLGVSWYYPSRCSLLCVQLWRCWTSASPFSFMQLIWFSLDVSSVMDWFSSADPQLLSDHFIQFISSTDGLKVRCSFLQLIWLLCIWVVWNERNNKILKNTENFMHQLLDKVKLYSFWWMEAKNANFVLGYHSWWSSPFTCLSIG